MTKRIFIPTINDTPQDFENLFAIWNQVKGYYEDVIFDFSKCGFLRPNAVVFLGGLARLILFRKGHAGFDWSTLSSDIMTNLCQNGFAGHFDYPSSSWTGNSIYYREDSSLDANGILDYLTYYWLGRGWLHISPRLCDAIVGHMWEIYNNAFEHAASEIGVFSCGQYFPNNNELVLSMVDFGRGIAANVRNFLRQDPRSNRLPAANCIQWAFQSGTTTLPNSMARGVGLDLLKEFIRANYGKLEVYSNEGSGRIDEKGEKFFNHSSSFQGTIFHITLTCDEKLYKFASEDSSCISS